MTAAARAVVIGAGIAGASAAWSLADELDVVLVEAEPQPGTHATGRSAAVLSETSGLPAVCALAAASRPFFESSPLATTPLLSRRGLLWVGSATSTDEITRTARAARMLGIDVDELDAHAARRLVPALRESWLAAAVFEPQAMSIDVAALLGGFLTGLKARRGELRLDRRATACSPHGDGGRVWCGDEHVDADLVVNAAGAWADELATRCGVVPAGLAPLRRTAFTFPVPDTDDWPLVMDVAGTFYFEPEGPGLLASPAEETPVEPHDARADELAMARAVDALDEATTLQVRGVTSRWAGLRTFAPDRLPVVGEDDDAPGFYWLAGPGGAGIKTAPTLAALLTALVIGRPLPDDLLAVGVRPEELSVARLRR